MSRKLLITGGAGFIGANFVHYWLHQHPQDKVIVLDALTYAANLTNLKVLESLSNYFFIHGDIRDEKLLLQILSENEIDTIVHFAAESHVDRSIIDPDNFIESNIIGTYQLLKAAKKVWLDNNTLKKNYRLHHVSTDEVYGSLNLTDSAFTESTAYSPNSPYAASKAAADHLVHAYAHTYGLPVTISNCSNNFGPYQFPEKLIPLLITHALQGKSLPIYGDGKNIRDWLYVEDHCRGIELILEKGKEGEVYNIGANNEQTNLKIVDLICSLLDDFFQQDLSLAKQFPNCPAALGQSTKKLIQFVTDRPGHDKRYAINAKKITTELGYQPKENFISGMQKTVQWYLMNEEWWSGLRNISRSDYPLYKRGSSSVSETGGF